MLTCSSAPQPDGYGPNITSPDTTDAFMSYAPFQSMAKSASTPAGYVQTFQGLNAASSANSYMGLYTINKYDPSICAKWCDQTTGCTAFNIYIERDPSLNPCRNDSTDPTVWGYWCPNPSSITNYKCTMWGSNLDATTAVNQGGWRRDFNVVITGSNGYDKTNITTPVLVLPPADNDDDGSSAPAASSSTAVASASSVSKAASTSSTTSAAAAATSIPVVNGKPSTGIPDPVWNQPQNCSGKAINAQNYWLGSKFINGPFDPSLCAAYAKATTAQNKQAAINAGKSRYTPCQMFNAYHIYKGKSRYTPCQMFNAYHTYNLQRQPARWHVLFPLQLAIVNLLGYDERIIQWSRLLRLPQLLDLVVEDSGQWKMLSLQGYRAVRLGLAELVSLSF